MTRATLMAVALALFAAASGATALADCSAEVFDVTGVVADRDGNPIGNTTVFILLDKASEKKLLEQGVRARNATTDASGRYHTRVDCAAHRRSPNEPNPCASKVRDVTVAASGRDLGMQLRGFKLGKLDTRQVAGVCIVQVPKIRVRGSR